MVPPLGPHLGRPPQSSKQECVTGRHLADAAPHPPLARGRPRPIQVTPASQEGQPGPSRCRLRLGRASGCPAVSEASGSAFLAQAPALRPLGHSLLAAAPQAGGTMTAACPLRKVKDHPGSL